MNEQKKLFRQIQMYSFALYETAMYLDAHPNERRALEHYKKYQCRLDELNRKYESHFGPLTIGSNSGPTWKWCASPWPWEYDSI